MKNKFNSLLLPAFLILVILVSFGTFIVGRNTTKREPVKVESCQTKGSEHRAVIENDQIDPKTIEANVCDTLTIINNDGKLRLVAFGIHSEHIYYDGVTEKPLSKGESLSITLNQRGTYLFHDHLQEEVQANFTVQ